MARTNRHTEEAKYNNGIISLDEVSTGTRKRWHRKNFDGGRFRSQRRNKYEDQIEKQSIEELINYKNG